MSSPFLPRILAFSSRSACSVAAASKRARKVARSAASERAMGGPPKSSPGALPSTAADGQPAILDGRPPGHAAARGRDRLTSDSADVASKRFAHARRDDRRGSEDEEIDLDIGDAPTPCGVARRAGADALAVDDDPDIRTMLRHALGKTYTITRRRTGSTPRRSSTASPRSTASCATGRCRASTASSSREILRKDKVLRRIPILCSPPRAARWTSSPASTPEPATT